MSKPAKRRKRVRTVSSQTRIPSRWKKAPRSLRRFFLAPMFNIALVEPEIPPNTGNVARLCLATGSRLHLVKPLGFSIDDRRLQRAGMDYWHRVDIRYWENLVEFAKATEAPIRRFLFTTKCERPYWDQEFRREDFLIFGRETRGLPESFLGANARSCLTIPIVPTARSLNLSNAVAIALFEGVRQLHCRRA
jgi:tRNA (cytidine/uridine-2'-O-)-methyltransferase